MAQTEFKEALNVSQTLTLSLSLPLSHSFSFSQATHYNLKQYKAEADQQFANSLAVEKKNKLKSLKG